MIRDDDWRIGTYDGFANDLLQQFEGGESVDTGNLTYLRDFSPDSRQSYERLMDDLAYMYGVMPRDRQEVAQVFVDPRAEHGRDVARIAIQHLNPAES